MSCSMRTTGARIALERARELAEKNGRCLDVATIDLLESTRKFLPDEVSFAVFQKAIEQWSRTPDALSVPGSEHLAQLMTTIMGSAPVDPQLPVRSGMLSDGTVELLQAGALFNQGREFPLVYGRSCTDPEFGAQRYLHFPDGRAVRGVAANSSLLPFLRSPRTMKRVYFHASRIRDAAWAV
jgi:hypothetical protein